MHSDNSYEDSAPLHIHDCDVQDDIEVTAIRHAGEIPTGLADETVIASAPRVPTQEQVAEKYLRPDRYVKNDDLLEWDEHNTVPDVLAMTEQQAMNAKIWIPIFTGKHFKNFIEKFEDLREVLHWSELTSRAYLLRSIHKLDPSVISHIASWTYGAMVIYLCEKYTPVEERLAAIDRVMEIQRGRLELYELSARISSAISNAALSRDQKQALAGAAFRHALRTEPALVEHIERSLYVAPRFFEQVDVARMYERRHGPEKAAVVTDGGNDLATLQVRGTPLLESLHTPKRELEDLSDSDTPCQTVRVNPITSRGARRPHHKTRKAAKEAREVLQLQTPVVYVDRVYPRWGGTMYVVLEFAGLTEPVHLLVDTGAAVSILPEPYYKRLQETHRVLLPNELDIRASNNTPIVCQGRVQLQFTIRHYHKKFSHDFYVCNESTTPLLGMDFMSEHNTLVHLRRDKFAIEGVICTTYDETGRVVRQGMTQESTSTSS